MKKFSIRWKSSRQPRKQHKYRHNAPLHVRQKLMAANLDKTLRREHKKRSLPLRKGDEVKIMRGKYRGRSGKVSKVDLKNLKVYVDNIKVKKPSGQEVEAALESSNMKIVKIGSEDTRRMKFRKRKTKV